MEKLKALTAFLRNRDILKKAGIKCNPEKIDSWSDQGTPDYLGETGADMFGTDGNGLYLFDHVYRGIIDLEEVAGDLNLLIAVVIAWLEVNDPDRDKVDNRKIQWTGVPFDDGTSDIRIVVWFYEKIFFKRAPTDTDQFAIEFKGNDFILGEEEIDTAENDEDLPPIDVEIEDD